MTLVAVLLLVMLKEDQCRAIDPLKDSRATL